MKYFLIILSILLLLGGGILVWYFTRGTSSNTTNTANTENISNSTEPETSSEPASDSGELSGTFTDLLAYGHPAMCTWHAPEGAGGEFQTGDGTFYTDGVSRGRVEATFTADGVSLPTTGIFIDEDIYYWQTIQGLTIGSKISRASLENSADDLTAEEQAQAMNIRNSYDFSCQPWTVDASMFEVPTDINFVSI